MKKCDKIDCKNEGKWHPVLEARTTKDGVAALFSYGLVICDEHKATIQISDLVTDASWEALCFHIIRQGFQKPVKEYSTITFIRFGEQPTDPDMN